MSKVGKDSYNRLADEVVSLMEMKGGYAGIEKLEEERDAGNIEAVTILGELYCEGVGVIPDTEMGLQLLNQAAEAGSAHANEILGIAYQKGNYGLEQNDALGHIYYEKAANAGLPSSIGYCASDYFWGWGVPVDEAKGVELATRGAKLGDYFSNRICGIAYQTGSGVPVNIPLAIQHYREALRIEPDDGEAMCGIATCLADPFGEFGGYPSPNDLSEAFALLSRGVELGNVRSHYVLGVCYANGVGVQQDYDIAHHYIELAAQNGDTDAQDALGQFRRTMRGTWTI